MVRSAHIWICQANASQTVSIAPYTADKFVLKDGSTLTTGYELDSPGSAYKSMCVHLVYRGITTYGVWVVFDETSAAGTDASWVSGGAAD